MELKFKKLSKEAVLPSYATNGSNGMDLTATKVHEFSHAKHRVNMYIEYGTDLSVKIPEGHVGLLFPRSSVSNKGLMLANCVGVIDSDYEGEIKLRFKQFGDNPDRYDIGDRIGQLVIMPAPKCSIVDADDVKPPLEDWKDIEPAPVDNKRGKSGFGSSGK